jgi:hypothetical protein
MEQFSKKSPSLKYLDNFTVEWDMSKLTSVVCSEESEYFVGLSVPELEKLLFVF